MALELVQRYDALLAAGDYDAAAALMEDTIVIQTPFGKKTKETYTKDLRKDKSPPVFEGSQLLDNGQVVTAGTKKIGFLTLKIKRTIGVNEALDRIISMAVKK